MHNLKRLLTPLSAIIATTCLLLGLAAAPASAASEEHFLLISTHGLPIWSADAQLYAQDGTRVFEWKQPNKSGGRAKWPFIWHGDKGWINFKVSGVSKTIWFNKYRLDRDYCILVDAGGTPRYTGDSVTGGCNGN